MYTRKAHETREAPKRGQRRPTGGPRGTGWAPWGGGEVRSTAEAGPNAPRSKLIEATREYIAQEKQRTEKEYLQAYRAIVQRTGLSSG